MTGLSILNPNFNQVSRGKIEATVTLEGRTFTFALRCGERVVEKLIKVPFPMDCGVYRTGKAYETGDVVTFGGSQWIALKNTTTKPPSDDWRLCVAKGRDGKDSQ